MITRITMTIRLSRALLTLAASTALAACTPGTLDPIERDPRSAVNSLVAYWSFDDAPGSATVKDRSGHNHDGTLAGGATFGTGHFGGALILDGTGEVAIADFPQPAASSWSVSAWVRMAASPPSSDSFTAIISNEWLRTGGWELNLQNPSVANVYEFGYWVGPNADSYTSQSCTCTSTEWTHLAAVVDRDNSVLVFYQNGLFSGRMPTVETPPGIKGGDPTLYMGRWPPMSTQIAIYLMLQPESRHFNGAIDDVAIYDRALAESEVAALALAPVLSTP